MDAKEQSGIEVTRENLKSDNRGFRKRKICKLEVLQKKKISNSAHNQGINRTLANTMRIVKYKMRIKSIVIFLCLDYVLKKF